MFRKIHSKRDPEATVYSELRREFSGYFDKANGESRRLLQAHPKPAFWGMLLLLLLSAALSFTIFRHPAPPAKPALAGSPAKVSHPSIDDGFGRILATGAALQQTLRLRTEVEAVLSKGRLSHADSLILERALDSLAQIHHQINHAP